MAEARQARRGRVYLEEKIVFKGAVIRVTLFLFLVRGCGPCIRLDGVDSFSKYCRRHAITDGCLQKSLSPCRHMNYCLDHK